MAKIVCIMMWLYMYMSVKIQWEEDTYDKAIRISVGSSGK